MLTPQDVRSVQFEKNLRGYRTEDVDHFLDKVEQQLGQDAEQMEALRKHGVKIAIASDLNPGTSPGLSLRLMLNMACTLFRMTPEEALAGVTLHAATALGMGETHGSLEPGKVADFVAWNIDRPADLAYWLGGDLDKRVVRSGVDVTL